MAEEDSIKRRYREFLDLIPLTLSIAGLPPGEAGKYLTSDQMELRAQQVVTAFGVARKTVREAIRDE